jgi:hypothetical protein
MIQEDPFVEMNAGELRDWLRDAAKLWLAHDGLWFQAVEKTTGMQRAIALDAEAWGRFSPIEARRIMKRLGIRPGGGIDALVRCLAHRLYSHLNEQEVLEQDQTRCRFRMRTCRVQEARKRKGLPDFPCREVGLVEYATFAATVDPRIRTRCVACPPDPHPDEWYCCWEFTLQPVLQEPEAEMAPGSSLRGVPPDGSP